MEPPRISAIAHAQHPIAAPLSDDSVRQLLERAIARGDERVLDLGCGAATWLLRATAGRPALRAVGVDIDPGTVTDARNAVAEAGLGDRIVLHAEDAKGFASAQAFDLVVSVGASHAFGGLLPTLNGARRHLASGGCVLVGECFWERAPDQATFDVGFAGDEYADLATTVDGVLADGWTPIHGHVSTLQEWDDYELSWTGALSRWALDRPEHPDRDEALETANRHRANWLRGYRGTLGFVTLLLRRTNDPHQRP